MDRRGFFGVFRGRAASVDIDGSGADAIAKTAISVASCLAWNGTMCYACKDSCEAGAIVFFGAFRPTINENCTNCGECAALCPSSAISVCSSSVVRAGLQ